MLKRLAGRANEQPAASAWRRENVAMLRSRPCTQQARPRHGVTCPNAIFKLRSRRRTPQPLFWKCGPRRTPARLWHICKTPSGRYANGQIHSPGDAGLHSMAEQKGIVRQWIVIRHLARPTGATVRELAEVCGVSQKTIRRDLEDLQSAGFPLNEETGARGRKSWTLRFPVQAPGLGFNYDEALALYMSRLFMLPLAGTHLDQAAHSAYGKLRAQLSPGAVRFVDRLGGSLYVTRAGMPDYSDKIEVIDTLAHALAEGHEVVMLYHSASSTEPVEYHIEPYGMCLHRASLYLVAWSRDHGEFRTFKLNRIHQVEDKGFAFKRRPFELERFLAGSFGVFNGDGDVQVAIRFSPQVAQYVRESNWHHSQQLQAERDGSLILCLRLSNTTEVKSWVLSFGAEAEVLSPPELRAEILAEVERLVAAYGRAPRTVLSGGAANQPDAKGRLPTHAGAPGEQSSARSPRGARAAAGHSAAAAAPDRLGKQRERFLHGTHVPAPRADPGG